MLVHQGALEKARSLVVPYFSKDGTFSPPPASKRPPNKTPISAHYNFEMAQQVFFPNNPLQPNPIYFLTHRKCSIFGVYCSLTNQLYLIDEPVNMRKGSNAIVSMLHHISAHHRLGEEKVHLPACRQLVGRIKICHHGAVFIPEGDDWPAQDHALIHDSRPY